jgi:hypothetical protein
VRAQQLGLRPGDRDLLESWTRSSSIRAGLAQRARIVLLAADGVSNTEIAERVGVSRPTVIGWRDRYLSSGVRGLEDERRSGRHAESAAGRARGDALVVSAIGRLFGGGCLDGAADLAASPGAAVAGGDV